MNVKVLDLPPSVIASYEATAHARGISLDALLREYLIKDAPLPDDAGKTSESWAVATRPRDANGFGYFAQFAAEGISKIKRLFYLLGEADDIDAAWEKLVLSSKVLGRNAYDARLVAAMQLTDLSQSERKPYRLANASISAGFRAS